MPTERPTPHLTPRFSVVIPTYNRAALLPTAIGSVLAQTERDFELIVVDDGSTDATAAVVASFDDPRITYHPQPNSGVSAARNNGAAIARGEFLVFLDSDDELLPNALEQFGRAAAANDWDIVLSPWIAVSPDRRTWRTARVSTGSPQGRSPWLPGAFAIRRDLFADAGGYDEQLRFAENTELSWRARPLTGEHEERLGAIDEPLVIRYSQAERPYDFARYEAARRILDRHADSLAREPRRRSIYRAIGGVSAARLGRRREALALATAAVRDQPRSAARYGNLFSVVRSCLMPSRRAPEQPAAPLAAVVPDSTGRARAAGAIHGVLITFGRPESLTKMVGQLADAGVDSLTIVDNAPSVDSKAAAFAAAERLPPTYLPMTENTGPAGGYAVGMTHVLATADDDDWVLVLDDDRLTGSDGSVRQLRDFGEWMLDRGAPVGAVGLVGARFDRRSGRLNRLGNEELAGPVTVDYVAGNQLPTIRVAALRKVGVFDASLFFGFDDLDFCLRLKRAGLGVYAYGPAWLEARRRFDRLDPEVESVVRRENAWRRYYGVRNHIVIMRRYASLPRAVLVTVLHLFGRPTTDLVKRRAGWLTLTKATARGCVDAWTGRLGRTMEPKPEPAVQTLQP